MNPIQFTTEEEANYVLKVHGPQTGSGELFIPDYNGQSAPTLGNKSFYHVHFMNGYTSNAGLLLDNIKRYGEKMARNLHAVNMKNEGRWVVDLS